MGLKCSVLGHAYGETTVERDREERGSEVVITIRELETCDRCGDTRIVTENKEVTTIETPDGEPDVTPEDAIAAMDDEGDADAGEAGGASEATAPETGGASGASAPATAAGEDDGEVLVDDAEGEEPAVAEGESVDDESDAPAPDAVEDQGAEILDAEGEATEDDAVDEELADPTIENDADVPGETVGESPDDEDAVILDDEPAGDAASSDDGATPAGTDESAEEGATASGDESSGSATAAAGAAESGPFDPPEDDDDDDPLGEWPEETLRDDDESWTPTEELSGTVDDIDPDENVDREFTTNSAVTVPEGEFHCDECGYTTDVEASSLRAGDFCPECHSGTLVHRPDE